MHSVGKTSHIRKTQKKCRNANKKSRINLLNVMNAKTCNKCGNIILDKEIKNTMLP